ncbi:MAG: CvpA family protein [Elusimicrobia bacterium]|nr:CvpA family protein [Elusimicrobiota bacterium]
MRLDLWLLGVIVVFGLLGAFSGAVAQAAQWVALALAYATAKPLTEAIGPGALSFLPPAAAPVALRVLVMLAVYIGARLLLGTILGKFLPPGPLRGTNRAAGAAMGAAKGGVLVWVLLSVVIAFDEPLSKAGWDLDKLAGDSHFLAFTRRHALMDAVRWSFLDGAKKLAAVRSDPKAAAELMKDPDVQAALEDPELKAIFADPELQKALQEMDVSALMKDPRIQKLLSDPDAVKKLSALGQ